jgi:SAM-dependent MidA family methyltransferase
VPDAQLKLRAEQLLSRLRERIVRRGSLSFMEYMQLALYEPGLGYYVAGLRKFGESGDFVTAPEVSPLFARCIARQAQQVLSCLGGGDVLEFGAGSGALAVELLLELEALDSLPEQYSILEVSPDLRQLQREMFAEKVPQLLHRIQWFDEWPIQFRGFAFGNEVLDAMPVERFRWQEGHIQQARVVLQEGKPTEIFVPADADLAADVNRIRSECSKSWPESWPENFTSEINRWLMPWFDSFTQATESAALLLIDYGYPRDSYYHPMRADGTLRCHYRHHAHDDPYLHPGLQDISAHVDFSAVAEAGTQSALTLEGYTTQQQFLHNCGLFELVEAAMAEADQIQRLKLSQQVKQLTLPGQMGETFSAIGFSKNLQDSMHDPMCGFAVNDQSHRL